MVWRYGSNFPPNLALICVTGSEKTGFTRRRTTDDRWRMPLWRYVLKSGPKSRWREATNRGLSHIQPEKSSCKLRRMLQSICGSTYRCSLHVPSVIFKTWNMKVQLCASTQHAISVQYFTYRLLLRYQNVYVLDCNLPQSLAVRGHFDTLPLHASDFSTHSAGSPHMIWLGVHSAGRWRFLPRLPQSQIQECHHSSRFTTQGAKFIW